jgi:hypothetical protein
VICSNLAGPVSDLREDEVVPFEEVVKARHHADTARGGDRTKMAGQGFA